MYLLVGTQNDALIKALSESLAGRVALIPFQSLSAQEWRSSPVSAGRPGTDFWLRGGYPGVWRDPAISRERWYQGYLTTYLERDVCNLLRVTSLRDFERFLRACDARCAQSVNMTEIGRDVGISATTAGTGS